MKDPYPSSIKEIFNSNNVYHLPLYQRQYSWGDKELKKFKEDMDLVWESTGDSTPEQIFLGAVVLQSQETQNISVNYYNIIE